ncbi:hypothetical protein [Nocardia amamiensis]|uniref:hypothetical protein n=1 Tax=Nocardia amamiensis TaxID=404578 RepID=UPI00082CC077|nr:hypothetical protein [Nocardia amamiensis]
MRTTHEELVRLAEAVPDDQVQAAAALLRQLVRKSGRRTFHSAGVASAEPDLAERAKEIVREELDRGTVE